jgi:hypothetical protein
MRTLLMIAASLGVLAGPAQMREPNLGKTTFTSYEGFLSPHQEPAEEGDAPKLLPTPGGHSGHNAPAIDRDKRTSQGYGLLRFSKDLSFAMVDVKMTGINANDITMFHIHCGPPGFLGPIVVDFGKRLDLPKALAANGTISLELTNKDIVYTEQLPEGFNFKLPEGCPSEVGFPAQVTTIAGLEYLARKGVLYFNLHSKAHAFFGEMRGQIYAVKE